MRRRWRAALAVLLVAGLAASGCAPVSVARPKLTVLASWTGAEQEQFRQVLDRFEEDTGIEVDYQGTRDVEQALAANVLNGTAPDVAVLPSLRVLADYANQDDLVPLGGGIVDRSQYTPQWRFFQELGRPDHELYVVPVKADLKDVIWYSVSEPDRPPRTWDELVAPGPVADGTVRWCMGMSAPPASGWPGTDWIEDILLHGAGRGAYDEWVRGRLPREKLRQAFQTWGDIMAAESATRGPAATLLTDFADAGRPMLHSGRRCAFHHQPSFIMGRYESYVLANEERPRAGRHFDFASFPGVDESEVRRVSADFAGMFRDSPQARELMRFLAAPEGQRLWPRTSGGRAFSVNTEVGGSVYPDDVSNRIATVLTSSDTLCLDASDLMSPTLRNAFYRAVLEFVGDPGRLEPLLADLKRIADSPSSEIPACAEAQQ